jgi:hypothetical protein
MSQKLPLVLKKIYSTQADLFPECSLRLSILRDGLDRYLASLSANIAQVELANKEYLEADSTAKESARQKFMIELCRFQNDFMWSIDYLKTESAWNQYERNENAADWFYSKTLPPERYSMKAARESRSLMSPLVDYHNGDLALHSAEALAVAARVVFLSTKHLADKVWDETFLKCRHYDK